VLAGCVDVAADVEAGLGDVLAGEPAEDFLLGLDGPYGALADVVGGPDSGVVAEPQDVVLAAAAEFQQVPAGLLGGGVPGAGNAGHVTEPGEDGVAELADQRIPDVRGDLGLASVTGSMPGADQPAQGPLRLPREAPR
jgi:hypothetical protein